MSKRRQPPQEQVREHRPNPHATHQTRENAQDFSRREIQRGTQRSEAETASGQHRDAEGNPAPLNPHPEHEAGDSKRPYKRGGH